MIDWTQVTPEEWDVARRVSDAMNLHLHVNPSARGWIACRMDDGRSNGDLYEKRSDAVRHHMKAGEESFYFYLKVHPGGMAPKEAWVMVVYFRSLRDKGIRPDHEEVVMPHRAELLAPVAPRLVIPRQYRRMAEGLEGGLL
jgi:hypothetical protein